MCVWGLAKRSFGHLHSQLFYLRFQTKKKNSSRELFQFLTLSTKTETGLTVDTPVSCVVYKKS